VSRSSVTFFLNGIKTEISGADLFRPLSSFLRYRQGLTGTKVVCAEGDCGACTVMIARAGAKNYESHNSCIAQCFGLDGANVVTVEGLAKGNELSEVQSSMVRNFGGQCGFCTPGFVMAITCLHEMKANPTAQQAKNFLTGNLCRCTGYSPIIMAALDVDATKHVRVRDRCPAQTLDTSEAVLAVHENNEFYAPLTMKDACAYKLKNPDVIIFSGATDLGVQINKGHLVPRRLMSLHLIKDLFKNEISGGKVYVGARVTLSELQNLVKDQVPSVNQFLNIFASPQIKNAATLVGNLANASPIADMTPSLMSLDAEVILAGVNGERVVALHEFYTGYKKLNLNPGEIISAVRFSVPGPKNKIENYKISQRRDLDISTVNASFNFELNDGKIVSARLALGGVAATTVRLTDVESKLAGTNLKDLNLAEVKKQISDSITPLSDHRGTAEYRRLLAVNLFEKYYNEALL
jgi:xanthine dehydrogenase small subunit